MTEICYSFYFAQIMNGLPKDLIRVLLTRYLPALDAVRCLRVSRIFRNSIGSLESERRARVQKLCEEALLERMREESRVLTLQYELDIRRGAHHLFEKQTCDACRQTFYRHLFRHCPARSVACEDCGDYMMLAQLRYGHAHLCAKQKSIIRIVKASTSTFLDVVMYSFKDWIYTRHTVGSLLAINSDYRSNTSNQALVGHIV